ncbi:hypothetical protein LNP25_24325 [Klebsiella variicola subsp. variicola]|nr:hypothetical protein [Klebsiella variicola subsp. variicola]
MKYFIGMAVTLLLSTPVLAAGELEINQSPLTLVLSDQNQARVSSCADFIALRKAGETVDALPGLSDPDGPRGGSGVILLLATGLHHRSHVIPHCRAETNPG